MKIKIKTRNPLFAKFLQALGIEMNPVIRVPLLGREWEITEFMAILEQPNPVERLMALTGKPRQEVEAAIQIFHASLQAHMDSIP